MVSSTLWWQQHCYKVGPKHRHTENKESEAIAATDYAMVAILSLVNYRKEIEVDLSINGDSI